MNPDDFLAKALRQSRDAVADDGFSVAVVLRFRSLRRRQRIARRIRVFCATSTVVLAGFVFGYVTTKAGMLLAWLVSSLALASTHAPAPVAALARLGLPLWMILAALGALLFALFPNRHPRAAFHF